MILVTGAAGKTGKAVIKALARSGAKVRALVRRPDRSQAMQALGAAEISIGSFEDAAALGAAVSGTEAIYHVCPNVSRDEVAYAEAIMAAAQANQVKRFVYHSVLHPQIEAMPHHWKKMRVEERLLAAGFDLTILQPAAYMQNILGAWRGIVEEGVYRIPYPAETQLSLVDLEDVAAAAAVVLGGAGHSGATYQIVGTAPISQNEIATMAGRALKKQIRIEAEPVEDWEARNRLAGMPDYQRMALAKMFRYYSQHGLVGNANTLRWLLGRPPHDFARFVACLAEQY
jgi:uncharacterized protein YbjT (DUF2867 family)